MSANLLLTLTSLLYIEIHTAAMLERAMQTLFRRGASPSRCIDAKSPYSAYSSSRRSYSYQGSIQELPRLSGALRSYKHVELIPALGTEFLEGSLTEMMSAPNSDELIRDLAITGRSSNIMTQIGRKIRRNPSANSLMFTDHSSSFPSWRRNVPQPE